MCTLAGELSHFGSSKLPAQAKFGTLERCRTGRITSEASPPAQRGDDAESAIRLPVQRRANPAIPPGGAASPSRRGAHGHSCAGRGQRISGLSGEKQNFPTFAMENWVLRCAAQRNISMHIPVPQRVRVISSNSARRRSYVSRLGGTRRQYQRAYQE